MPSFSTGIPYFIPMPIVSDKALLTDMYPIIQIEDPMSGSTSLGSYRYLTFNIDTEVMSGLTSIGLISLETQAGPVEKTIEEFDISGTTSLAEIVLKSVVLEKDSSEFAMSGSTSLGAISLLDVLITYSLAEYEMSGTTELGSLILTTP